MQICKFKYLVYFFEKRIMQILIFEFICIMKNIHNRNLQMDLLDAGIIQFLFLMDINGEKSLQSFQKINCRN
jgi:hypothetical protein